MFRIQINPEMTYSLTQTRFGNEFLDLRLQKKFKKEAKYNPGIEKILIDSVSL